jgi:hypothetical protein
VSDDATLVERVARKIRREGYQGEEKRAPSPVEWVKFIPLALAVLGAVAGYYRLEARVDGLRETVSEMKADAKEQHGAMWRAIRGSEQ